MLSLLTNNNSYNQDDFSGLKKVRMPSMFAKMSKDRGTIEVVQVAGKKSQPNPMHCSNRLKSGET